MADKNPIRIKLAQPLGAELLIEDSVFDDKAAFLQMRGADGRGALYGHFTAADVRVIVDRLTPLLPPTAMEQFEALPIGAQFYIVHEDGKRRDDNIRVKVSDKRYFVQHREDYSETPKAAAVLFPEGYSLEVVA